MKKQYNFVGCCGMSCVLCPRYHSQSKSQCPGCGLSANRQYCSTFKCCTEKHNYETCAQCSVFPCERLFRLADWPGLNTRKKWIDNLKMIKEKGIEQWFNEQLEKERMLKEAFQYFNRRMRSFFCLSFFYFDIDTIKKLLAVANSLKGLELKERARVFQESVTTEARRHNLKIWND